MVYDNIWEWEGKTSRSVSTTGRSIAGYPTDPFPFDEVVQTAKIAILAELTGKMEAELAAIGITATVTRIEPEVWITTSRECSQFRDWTTCTWYHWLHMKAKVYFDTEEPLAQSPVGPLTLAALVRVLEYLILVVAAGLVILGIAKIFIESFLVETTTISTHSPDCTTTTETIKKPSWEGAIALAVGAVIVVGGVLFIRSLLKED